MSVNKFDQPTASLMTINDRHSSTINNQHGFKSSDIVLDSILIQHIFIKKNILIFESFSKAVSYECNLPNFFKWFQSYFVVGNARSSFCKLYFKLRSYLGNILANFGHFQVKATPPTVASVNVEMTKFETWSDFTDNFFGILKLSFSGYRQNKTLKLFKACLLDINID